MAVLPRGILTPDGGRLEAYEAFGGGFLVFNCSNCNEALKPALPSTWHQSASYGLKSLYQGSHLLEKLPLPFPRVSVSPVVRASRGDVVQEDFPEEVAFGLRSGGGGRGGSQTRWGATGSQH